MFHILDHLGRLLSGRKQQGSVMHENLSCSLQLVFCFILVLISFSESQIETESSLSWGKRVIEGTVVVHSNSLYSCLYNSCNLLKK